MINTYLYTLLNISAHECVFIKCGIYRYERLLLYNLTRLDHEVVGLKDFESFESIGFLGIQTLLDYSIWSKLYLEIVNYKLSNN